MPSQSELCIIWYFISVHNKLTGSNESDRNGNCDIKTSPRQTYSRKAWIENRNTNALKTYISAYAINENCHMKVTNRISANADATLCVHNTFSYMCIQTSPCINFKMSHMFTVLIEDVSRRKNKP